MGRFATFSSISDIGRALVRPAETLTWPFTEFGRPPTNPRLRKTSKIDENVAVWPTCEHSGRGAAHASDARGERHAGKRHAHLTDVAGFNTANSKSPLPIREIRTAPKKMRPEQTGAAFAIIPVIV